MFFEYRVLKQSIKYDSFFLFKSAVFPSVANFLSTDEQSDRKKSQSNGWHPGEILFPGSVTL